MGVFIGSVVLNAGDNARASEFWGQALGYVARPQNADFLTPPEWTPPSRSRADHRAAHLHVDTGDTTHLDLWLDDDADLETEVARLVSLGATRVAWDYPEDADFVVLADTEGNLFCVVS
jgi:Glyoxalase-like domain